MSKHYMFVSWKPKGKGRPSSDHIVAGTTMSDATETLCEIKVPVNTSVVAIGAERHTKKECDVCRIVKKHIDRVLAEPRGPFNRKPAVKASKSEGAPLLGVPAGAKVKAARKAAAKAVEAAVTA